MVFGIIPECRSDSLRNQRSASPESAINTIRAWLGHVSLDTTNIYAEIDLEMKAKALAKCAVTDTTKSKRRWRDDPALMTFLRTL